MQAIKAAVLPRAARTGDWRRLPECAQAKSSERARPAGRTARPTGCARRTGPSACVPALLVPNGSTGATPAIDARRDASAARWRS
jgi:hypothetical protein